MVSLDSPRRGIGAGGGISEGVCVLERCCGVCGRGHGSARHRAVVENVRRGRCEERVALRADLRAERIADIRRGLSIVNFGIVQLGIQFFFSKACMCLYYLQLLNPASHYLLAWLYFSIVGVDASRQKCSMHNRPRLTFSCLPSTASLQRRK